MILFFGAEGRLRRSGAPGGRVSGSNPCFGAPNISRHDHAFCQALAGSTGLARRLCIARSSSAFRRATGEFVHGAPPYDNGNSLFSGGRYAEKVSGTFSGAGVTRKPQMNVDEATNEKARNTFITLGDR